jgi:carboxypeptidase C (cathepsin A)
LEHNTASDLVWYYSKYEQKIPLQGLIIGNGWVDPLTMYQSYYNITVLKNLLPEEKQARGLEKLKVCENNFLAKAHMRYQFR